jgi:hypothetical protein
MTVKSFNGIDFEYIFNYNDLGEPISKISNDYSDITLTHDALFKLMKEIADRMGYNITNMQTPTMESITHLQD